MVASGDTGLAVTARKARLQHHPLTDAKVGIGGVGDLAGDIRAADVRQRQLDDATAVPQVEMIERAGADPTMTSPDRIRDWARFVTEHLGPPCA